ncbi:MAG: TonB C-terminal domain-containing protein [Candidatus Aminicenantes bacterium]|nr:MAG: TonB C-terminal domain-containing protein [Candidatus Aminicenantes bacterium]
MVTYIKQYPLFKKFVYISISFHIILFFLMIFSPKFPSLGRKKMIHYVSLHSFSGGGGGGRLAGGGPSAKMQPKASESKEELVETPAESGQTLRDLTTPQKLDQQSLSSLRYPVEKPKREKNPPAQKKAVIQKQDPSAKKPTGDAESDAEEGTGSGSAISLGVGTGSGGGAGFGSEFSSQIGLSNFPFDYYLENMIGRISSNWLKTQISSGLSDELFTVVRFKIYRDGKISVVDIEHGCGIRTLDLAAVRAIQSSAPFAPLPDGYEEDSLIIHLRFEHIK